MAMHLPMEYDGDALAYVVSSQTGPCLGALCVHGHVDLRLSAHIAVGYAGIGYYASVERSLAVTGVDLDGDQLVIVAISS